MFNLQILHTRRFTNLIKGYFNSVLATLLPAEYAFEFNNDWNYSDQFNKLKKCDEAKEAPIFLKTQFLLVRSIWGLGNKAKKRNKMVYLEWKLPSSEEKPTNRT